MGASATKESKYYSEFERVNVPSLQGKVVAITGCTTGTGYIAAQCAARKGAQTILMLNRSSERATAAEATVKEQIPKDGSSNPTVVETIPCDLQDTASVQEAIRIIKSKYDKIDVLCNNAGIMGFADVATKDGYDIQMQTNHLSHFLLTKELFPLLQKSDDGRIVSHSSIMRSGSLLKPEYFGKNGGNLGGNGNSVFFNGGRWERYVMYFFFSLVILGFCLCVDSSIVLASYSYHQTKLANSCFSAALAAKLEASGISNVKAVCAAPGVALTDLQVNAKSNGAQSPWIIKAISQSAEDGTMPLLTAMFGTDTKNGDFYEPKSFKGVYGKVTKVKFDKNSASIDQQQMLWEKSEEACGKFTI
jgi:NAD(P)-dependent dehydrogenase (short-subunit alcohol dehydrogenase family)